MKMIKFMIVLVMVMAMATPAMAGGLWDLVKNSDLATRQAKAFQIEVKGVNTRVYVFHVPEMKSVCTQGYGDTATSTMVCKTYAEMNMTQKEINALPH